MKTTLHGQVVAAFGRHYEVKTSTGDTLQCVTRGKKNDVACGDKVSVQQTSSTQGVITEITPRQSLLYRSDAFRQKLIAANVTQVIVVTATSPSTHEALVSRCLIAAENQGLESLIVLNKCDLKDELTAARKQLSVFVELGYRVLELSAKQDVSPLSDYLSNHVNLLVGQSGMGKSTLINTLVPDAEAATREISLTLDSGKHTTTSSRQYDLDANTRIIDSPGLQAFGLAHLDLEELSRGFPEFRAYVGKCRFRDCRHRAEPGCAIRSALEANAIQASRLALFHTLIEEHERASKVY